MQTPCCTTPPATWRSLCLPLPRTLLQVLGSLKCDCREQLQLAMEYIRDHPPGMVIYLQQVGSSCGACACYK